jgi:hypothetical protein
MAVSSNSMNVASVTVIAISHGLTVARALGFVVLAAGAVPTAENRKVIRKNVLTLDGTRWQYTHGVANPDSIAPESYTLDSALLERPGNKEIQLDLFRITRRMCSSTRNFSNIFVDRNHLCLRFGARMIPFLFPREQRHFGKTCRTHRSNSSIPDILR